MNLISIENISKSYSEKPLLENISLGINEGDKIGLIGINGTGKSTLLKIIAAIETADTGRVIIGNKVRINFLPQNPIFSDNANVLQQVFRGSSPIMKILQEYELVLDSLSHSNHDTVQEQKLISLSQKIDELNGWSIESEAKNILTKLGITDFTANINTLSGGQRKRVAMAAALIQPCDLLILDEPTNHIDNTTVDWLEEYLNKRKGSLLMVTHDRYFLDRVANRIIELDRGQLFSYTANYSSFLELKIAREDLEQATERKRQNLFKKELAWIRKGAKARTTKQKARIDRFEAIKESEPETVDTDIEIIALSTRLGRKIIELTDINKSYTDKILIKDFSYILLRDDRIGIIGPNGSGKSTLLNIMAGLIPSDSGIVEIGDTVKIGFFTQESKEMDESLRVIEYIKKEAEYVTTAEGKITASQMLERFLFAPAVQWTPISKLSGGEKRRLYLLNILMQSPNILLFDEPTNDLDIQTLTILESYLDEFQGAVVVVSHDRYFLDRTIDKIFSFEGNGIIKQWAGDYSYYHDNYIPQESETKDKVTQKEVDKQPQRKERPKKFTYKEQKEFETIDQTIADIESEIQVVKNKINAAASDYELLQKLLSNHHELEQKLDEAMERWAYLNELAEEIEQNKKG